MDDYKIVDFTVICFFSYGFEGYIYGRDGVLVFIFDFLVMFNGYIVKDLIGKLKLFFI